MNSIVTSKFDLNTSSIGLIILKRFLEHESIFDLAEDYQVNDLMIEEVLRQEVNKLVIKAYFSN